MSNLGFQLVYSLLNEQEGIICERFFLPERGQDLVSMESGRSLDQFPLIFFSISFEHDYLNLVKLLKFASIPPYASDRAEAIDTRNPLVVCGGVATFINPEPLAPFIDMFFLGEAESGMVEITDYIGRNFSTTNRNELLKKAATAFEGCYVPSLYSVQYDSDAKLLCYKPEPGIPYPVKRVRLETCRKANHSQLLTPETEFSNLFLTELGRGCSRGCRFCTAGFIYRPPRLWDADAVLAGLQEKFEGIDRVGLLGMEMMEQSVFDKVSEYLFKGGCSLSFSSLRADRIDEKLLQLLGESNLKNVTIAPDGSSERLRRVINKGLDEQDILLGAENLVNAGIFKLKLYLMIGLPSETDEDLQEAIELIEKIRKKIHPIGQRKGRLCEISVSVNCFAPKPWTPFQFHSFGGGERLEGGEFVDARKVVKELKRKQKLLQQGMASQSNVSLNMDKPENVLFQAVLSRGDRRVAEVLLVMAEQGKPWKQAMKLSGVQPEQFATCSYGADDCFPWDIVDHGIKKSYLWQDYLRAFEEKLTAACDTAVCRRCGVCHD